MSAGQTLTLTYYVNVVEKDDPHDQGSVRQTVTVTVNGSDKSIVYDTLNNVHATDQFAQPGAVDQQRRRPHDQRTRGVDALPSIMSPLTIFPMAAIAPLLLVNAASGQVLVELNGIKQLDFHLGNRDDTLDVSETATSPTRTVPIVADGGSFDGTGNTVVLGDAYAGLPHTAFAAIFASNGTTVIGVAITHNVGGVEITDRYTNFQTFSGQFSFNSLVQQLSLAELAFVPGRADPSRSSLTAVVNFAGPQETALLTLTDRDGNSNVRANDVVTWSGTGTFSPASGVRTDSHGMSVDTFTPTIHTTQTVTASFNVRHPVDHASISWR